MSMLSFALSIPIRPITRWIRVFVNAVKAPGRRRARRRAIAVNVRLAAKLSAAGHQADAHALRVLTMRASRLP